MKKSNIIISILVLLILVAIGGGVYYFMFANSKPQEEVVEYIEEESYPTISPEEIGLEFTAREDGKAVKFLLTNAEGIQSIDYEVTYLAKGDLPRGVIGQIVVDGSTEVDSDYIDLGSCSSGRCKYDEDVSNIKLVLKITKTDGSIYQAEETLELE